MLAFFIAGAVIACVSMIAGAFITVWAIEKSTDD